jgi:hypothetical protein
MWQGRSTSCLFQNEDSWYPNTHGSSPGSTSKENIIKMYQETLPVSVRIPKCSYFSRTGISWSVFEVQRMQTSPADYYEYAKGAKGPL